MGKALIEPKEDQLFVSFKVKWEKINYFNKLAGINCNL